MAILVISKFFKKSNFIMQQVSARSLLPAPSGNSNVDKLLLISNSSDKVANLEFQNTIIDAINTKIERYNGERKIELHSAVLGPVVIVEKEEGGNTVLEGAANGRKLDLGSSTTFEELKAVVGANIAKAEQDKAATTLQEFVRAFHLRQNATETKDDFTGVRQLKNEQGDVVGYAINRANPDFPWVLLPPPAPSGEKGSYKQVVGVGRHLELKLFREPPTLLDPEMKEFIIKNNLTSFVLQERVSRDRILTENLGPTLNTLINEGRYTFDVAHWIPLAKHLRILHDNGIVHRDLKVENFGLWVSEDGVVEVRPFDNDSMARVGTIKSWAGTPGMLPKKFQIQERVIREKIGKFYTWAGREVIVDKEPHIQDDSACQNMDKFRSWEDVTRENNGREQPINAYKKDELGFFRAMMFTSEYNYQYDEENFRFCEADCAQFVMFDMALPSDDPLAINLMAFLNDPENNRLTHPVDAYLIHALQKRPPSEVKLQKRVNHDFKSWAGAEGLLAKKLQIQDDVIGKKVSKFNSWAGR